MEALYTTQEREFHRRGLETGIRLTRLGVLQTLDQARFEALPETEVDAAVRESETLFAARVRQWTTPLLDRAGQAGIHAARVTLLEELDEERFKTMTGDEERVVASESDAAFARRVLEWVLVQTVA
jgi:hypothetical protein